MKSLRDLCHLSPKDIRGKNISRSDLLVQGTDFCIMVVLIAHICDFFQVRCYAID